MCSCRGAKSNAQTSVQNPPASPSQPQEQAPQPQSAGADAR